MYTFSYIILNYISTIFLEDLQHFANRSEHIASPHHPWITQNFNTLTIIDQCRCRITFCCVKWVARRRPEPKPHLHETSWGFCGFWTQKSATRRAGPNTSLLSLRPTRSVSGKLETWYCSQMLILIDSKSACRGYNRSTQSSFQWNLLFELNTSALFCPMDL